MSYTKYYKIYSCVILSKLEKEACLDFSFFSLSFTLASHNSFKYAISIFKISFIESWLPNRSSIDTTYSASN